MDEQKPKKFKMSRAMLIAISITLVLGIAFAIVAVIYYKELSSERELYENSVIRIVAFGEEIGVYKISDFLDLGIEEKEFVAIYDTSSSDPVEKQYIGLELKDIFNALEVDLASARSITFKASDGMQKVYSQQDVVKSQNVFVAYKVNGDFFNTGIDPLAHTKVAEDGGPFVVIRSDDIYSQSRCKLLVEINVD